MHTAKILRLSLDLPVVVEIVDSEAKINEFFPILDEMMTAGLVTLEKVQVVQYGKTKIGDGTNTQLSMLRPVRGALQGTAEREGAG